MVPDRTGRWPVPASDLLDADAPARMKPLETMEETPLANTTFDGAVASGMTSLRWRSDFWNEVIASQLA